MGLAAALLLCAVAHAANESLFNDVLKLAEHGNAQAQYNVGMMLNNGIGTKQDPKKAFAWFQKSARGGDPLAAYKVGCYYAGQFKGIVPIDDVKALENKLIAANAGYALAESDVAVSFYRLNKFEDAMHWWQKSADQGFPPALNNLAVSYVDGKIVTKDLVRGYAYYKIANLQATGRISADAQSALDRLSASMSEADVKAAEQMVAEWQPKLTALTQRADSGLEDAKKVLQANSN
jgi:TPR repeat protein